MTVAKITFTILLTFLLSVGSTFINPSFIFAVDCNISDPNVCSNTPGCHYTGTSCNQDPATTQDVTTFSQEYNFLLGAINLKQNLTTIPGILNNLVPLMIVLAGLVLFIMLIMGGFQMLTSATNPEAAEKGKQRITTAIIGFIIIFAAYWITQIVEVILGVTILG